MLLITDKTQLIFSVDYGKQGKFELRKSPSHKGDEDVWATDYKGDMFEVETTEEPVMAEWWIQLGKKEWTISIKVSA